MIPYLALLGSAAAGAIGGITRGRILLPFLGLMFFVAIGWRFRVGMDWNNYVLMLQRDSGKDLLELLHSAEPGFGFLLWAAQPLGGVTFLNVVSAAAFSLGLFAFAKRCREPFLAIMVATPYLVLAVAMSATRQALALGIIFFLFARWEQLRFDKKVLVVLFATLFHFSAFFNLAFVLLQSRMGPLVRVASAVLIAVVVLALIAYSPDRIAFYSETYVAGRRVLDSPGAVFHVLLLTIPSLFYLLFRRSWQRANGENELMDSLAVASVIALPALAISSTGVDRLSLYFWPIAMYVWAGLPALASQSVTRVAIRVLIITGSMALGLSWLLFANSSHAYLPYRSSLFGL